jgi:subtilisin family serine protease
MNLLPSLIPPPSAHFVSDDHLTNAYEKYLSHIKAADYRHVNARHPFLVQFPANCGIKCHSKIKKIVGSVNHNVISSEFAHLFIDESTLATLQRSHPEIILDSVPMLPNLKIEKSTSEFIAACKASANTESIPTTLSVAFAPLTTSDIVYLSEFFKAFPSSVQIQLDGPLRTNQEIHFSIHLDCHDAPKVVNIFSSLPFTLWIERRMQFQTFNRWSRGLCQSGHDTTTPMYKVNITGKGYIVGISDSGIDMTHCHFYDPNHGIPYNTVNMDHRKVIYYNKYVDGLDDSEGHGTHVSSTVAGRSYLDYGDYRYLL